MFIKTTKDKSKQLVIKSRKENKVNQSLLITDNEGGPIAVRPSTQ